MNGSILLVDDDGALLRALPETLRLRLPSLQVSTASSAAEARSLAAATDYDAIVTDIKMPGTDGLELLDALRRIRPDTPTLLITGHGDRDLAVRALRGGAYDFIQKPIDRDYIVASLERAIQSRRLTRKVEEQRRALARHARVVGQMSEGVFVVGADGRVELWNDAAATITWVPAASAVGRPIGEIFPGWDETADEIEVADANAVGVSAPVVVPVAVRSEELWLSFHAVAFEDAVIYTFRNAGAGRSLDELKNEFLATVSHELRTPVSSIYGAATTLAERRLATAERDRLLQMLVNESARLRRLVEDLLVASAIEINRVALTTEAVDPLTLVQSVVEAMRVAATREVAITLDLPDGDSAPPSLQTDGGKLRQVLTNLIENAVKYTREHSEVTVGVEPRETSLRFYVRDHGPGIALEEQRRIFDKFYRADPRLNNGVGGSGLGLYVSRELARRLEGRLSVHSTLGQGATFFLDLPLELQRAGRAPLGSAAS